MAGVTPVGVGTCFWNMITTECASLRLSKMMIGNVITESPVDARPLSAAPRSRFELGDDPKPSAFAALKTRLPSAETLAESEAVTWTTSVSPPATKAALTAAATAVAKSAMVDAFLVSAVEIVAL